MLMLNAIDSSIDVTLAVIIVIILNLEDVAYLPKVAALIEFEKLVLGVFKIYINTAFEDEVDTCAYDIQRNEALVFLAVFEAKTCGQLSHKLVIGSEAKFWILEENFKIFLKLLKQVLFNDLNLHIIWQLIVEIIFLQE